MGSRRPPNHLPHWQPGFNRRHITDQALIAIGDTAALFSETNARVLASVGHEDDVKFVGLCEARGIPVHRIGVTDGTNLETQGIANWELADLAKAHQATLPELFA